MINNNTEKLRFTIGGRSLEPGDTCLINSDGTVLRIDQYELQRQLDAANQRIAELTEQRNEISGHFSHLEICRDNATVRAETSERKLATAINKAFISGTSWLHNYQMRQSGPELWEAYFNEIQEAAKRYTEKQALAQVEQPHQQLPGEDPPFDACQCPACEGEHQK